MKRLLLIGMLLFSTGSARADEYLPDLWQKIKDGGHSLCTKHPNSGVCPYDANQIFWLAGQLFSVYQPHYVRDENGKLVKKSELTAAEEKELERIKAEYRKYRTKWGWPDDV